MTMDTSEQYVKMCSAAKEIQKIQELAHLDSVEVFHEWFACPDCGDIAKEDDGYYFTYCGDHEKLVWLPRQDQLQEMINLNEYINKDIMDVFWDFSLWADRSEQWRYVDTLEQLWLAFVMERNYQKVWDTQAQDWVTAKEG